MKTFLFATLILLSSVTGNAQQSHAQPGQVFSNVVQWSNYHPPGDTLLQATDTFRLAGHEFHVVVDESARHAVTTKRLQGEIKNFTLEHTINRIAEIVGVHANFVGNTVYITAEPTTSTLAVAPTVHTPEYSDVPTISTQTEGVYNLPNGSGIVGSAPAYNRNAPNQQPASMFTNYYPPTPVINDGDAMLLGLASELDPNLMLGPLRQVGWAMRGNPWQYHGQSIFNNGWYGGRWWGNTDQSYRAFFRDPRHLETHGLLKIDGPDHYLQRVRVLVGGADVSVGSKSNNWWNSPIVIEAGIHEVKFILTVPKGPDIELTRQVRVTAAAVQLSLTGKIEPFFLRVSKEEFRNAEEEAQQRSPNP